MFLKVPNTEEEWHEIAIEFNDLWNFPNCVSAIDGKHVVIQAPANSGSEFYNYKGRVGRGKCDTLTQKHIFCYPVESSNIIFEPVPNSISFALI